MGCTVSKVENNHLIKVESNKDHNENIPHLSDAQKDAVQTHWQTLKLHIANIGVRTYVSLFESRPELIQLFSNFKGEDVSKLQESGLLQQHALRLMATIDKCLTYINKPASMIYVLREVGCLHKKHNVQSDHLQIILPHFLNAIKPYNQETWCGELQEAWITFLSLICFHMKEGMQQKHGDFSRAQEAISNGT